MSSGAGVREFYQPLFGFVEDALRAGNSVMVRCISGVTPHRTQDVLQKTKHIPPFSYWTG
jgi:hypothetical protein